MSYFLKSGNTYTVASEEALNIQKLLPAGNYVVKINEMTGQFYLEHIEDFTAPRKIYGDCLKNTHRIMSTFASRDNSTGVLLAGEKGSGKTLLSKNIAMELAQIGIPTIVINAPWAGDKFNTFIQTITQPCMILFDEFEKTYDERADQESILTLLDGVFPSKKLFMLTCNDKWRIDQHMRNRPGRIFYLIDFKGLDAEFITEYCEDNLNAKEHIPRICQIASLFGEFNFDMLKAVVEEMNRYGESPSDAMRILNTKPEFDGGSNFNISLTKAGKTVKVNEIFRGNPLSRTVEFWYDMEPENDDGDNNGNVVVTANDLVSLDGKTGTFTFAQNDVIVVLTRIVEKTPYYFDAF
jgi:hypothetical protein